MKIDGEVAYLGYLKNSYPIRGLHSKWGGWPVSCDQSEREFYLSHLDQSSTQDKPYWIEDTNSETKNREFERYTHQKLAQLVRLNMEEKTEEINTGEISLLEIEGTKRRSGSLSYESYDIYFQRWNGMFEF